MGHKDRLNLLSAIFRSASQFRASWPAFAIVASCLKSVYFYVHRTSIMCNDSVELTLRTSHPCYFCLYRMAHKTWLLHGHCVCKGCQIGNVATCLKYSGSLTMTLLQIFCWISKWITFGNRSTVGEVMSKSGGMTPFSINQSINQFIDERVKEPLISS